MGRHPAEKAERLSGFVLYSGTVALTITFLHLLASVAREHAEVANPFLSLNFLPEAGSCAGELSAVKQRVTHACTTLALEVSGSCHYFPQECGKCKHLKGNKY